LNRKEFKLTDNEVIAKGKEVIKIEAKAIAGLENSINDEFVKAVNIIYNCRGRVILTGMGKSGLIARKIVATMNSTGTPAIYLHPSDAMHGDLGMVRKNDVVILISKSGNTEEVSNLIPLLKRIDIKMIAMCGAEDSRIVEQCDIFLNINVTEEACPHDLAPTSSTTATLVMGDALSVALLEKRGFTPEDFAFLHPGGSLGKRLSLELKEIMVKGSKVPVVKETTPLKDAILEITSKRLGSTTVVDENGILTGIITDGDLRRLLEKTLDLVDIKAKDVMSRNPKTLKENCLGSLALQVMENFKITSIIITSDKNEPIGIVHMHDLINLGLRVR
jgi:KpsF/GutQ family protein